MLTQKGYSSRLCYDFDRTGQEFVRPHTQERQHGCPGLEGVRPEKIYVEPGRGLRIAPDLCATDCTPDLYTLPVNDPVGYPLTLTVARSDQVVAGGGQLEPVFGRGRVDERRRVAEIDVAVVAVAEPCHSARDDHPSLRPSSGATERDHRRLTQQRVTYGDVEVTGRLVEAKVHHAVASLRVFERQAQGSLGGGCSKRSPRPRAILIRSVTVVAPRDGQNLRPVRLSLNAATPQQQKDAENPAEPSAGESQGIGHRVR